MDAGDLGPSAKVSSPSGTCEDIARLTNHARGSMCRAARAGALYATDRPITANRHDGVRGCQCFGFLSQGPRGHNPAGDRHADGPSDKSYFP
jgi:hypothetical protein